MLNWVFAALALTAGLCGSMATAQTYDMRFQFDQKGTPSLHTFHLKWANADSNLQSIDVLVSDTQEVIQTIAVPQDRVKILYKDIATRPDRLRDKFFDFVDYNFDKYGDLRLTAAWPYKVGEKRYLVWLFDEGKNQYVLHEGISALAQPVPDEKSRRIETITLGKWAGGEYVKQVYSITSKGNLKLQTSINQTIRWPDRMVFQRDVRQRIEGEMQRICHIVLPTEGVPQLIWGTKGRCAWHMKKHDL